jgi:hypothetical protein
MKKALFLIHRYLGLGMCLIMAAWCASGVVMMYVGYPALSSADRIAALPPLSFKGVRQIDPSRTSLAGISIQSFDIEMLEENPVLRLSDSFGPVAIVNLVTGQVLTEISARDARIIAADYFGGGEQAANAITVTKVDRDQWTISGEFDSDRPLFKASRGDPAGTEIYISSSTGKVVQQTKRWQRGWNWVGSVLHWLYFTALRQHGGAWTDVIIATSLLGVFLTVTGLWFGILQIRRSSPRGWSPYRGLRYWHHVTGLVFGILTLAWVGSGFLSVNPWGLLEGGGAGAEAHRLQGLDLSSDEALAVAGRFAGAALGNDVRRISSAPIDGKLYLLETTDAGTTRVDAATLKPAPLEPDALARLSSRLQPGIAISSQGMIDKPDSYYFAAHGAPPLPVYRIVLGDAQGTRYYLDPTDGHLAQKTDRNDRLYRWLFEAVHRWDFAAVLRQRGLWDGVMLFLMAGVGAVCLTGVYMAYRFLSGRPAGRN